MQALQQFFLLQQLGSDLLVEPVKDTSTPRDLARITNLDLALKTNNDCMLPILSFMMSEGQRLSRFSQCASALKSHGNAPQRVLMRQIRRLGALYSRPGLYVWDEVRQAVNVVRNQLPTFHHARLFKVLRHRVYDALVRKIVDRYVRNDVSRLSASVEDVMLGYMDLEQNYLYRDAHVMDFKLEEPFFPNERVTPKPPLSEMG